VTGRFRTLAIGAIVAPAAIVAVLGWISLRQWEASAELLFREQARDMASMAAEKVEMMLRHADDAFLERLGAALRAAGPDPGALDELVASTPLVGRLYLLDRQGRFVYPPGGARGEDDSALALARTEAVGDLWERGGRRDLVTGSQAWLLAVRRLRDGAPLLILLSRDPEAVRRQILEATLGGLESPTILAVLDAAGRPIYSRVSLRGAHQLLSVGFRESLPTWQLAVYQPPGFSPRQAVRRQVVVFTAAFLVLLAVIVVGILATWRLMRREAEMARLKSDFVANVSHDLKTPLSVIRMFGETLEMGRVADEARRHDYYRVIARESERLSRLIDNVLDFSRIEGGRRVYEKSPTAVEPLVRETLDAFAYPLAQQGFTVSVDVAPDLPEVTMDAEAVRQALANLVDNAIKYAGERRVLRIEARAEEGWLQLSVADEGIGVPTEEQARIFEKFYRVGRSETQSRRGSGVGLALVQHVAVAHGGSVGVESRPGEGSRFTLRLPVGGDA